ncbi:head-tail adaptor protein [Paracoccus bogoriensis]|uniref:head-tail adaptor protein n=1 Tax=Paracoccus bogoriensis TaxID=242065 RepID=UPI001C6810EB|nr:head-tail adaptor protein [Paracoccus bogoriensis]MBW7055714.1 head-tail adaptor protein [Paracoccus bogoriensis]
MPVPRLDVELTLENGARIADGMGGHRLNWQEIGRLWASLRARSGREKGSGAGLVSVVQWRITVRAAPAGDPRRPRPGQRFRLGARLFRIEAVAEADAGGRYLDCFAREEDSQ